MNKKLTTMMEKPSFAAYRLTEDSRLEILGPNHKTVDNYFLFDGTHYYFGNPLVKLSSNSENHCDMILAMTDTKLLLPQNEGSSLYIARNYPAHKDLVVVVLYYYDNYLYYSIVSGSGSGRVHPVYLPVSRQNFNFCFHFAVDAISKVNPQIAEELYASITKKVHGSKEELADGSSKESTTIIQSTT